MLVVNNNEVNLSCKYTYNLFSKEFRASLYKGVDSAVEVCAVNGNHSKSLQSTNKEFNCTVNLGNETVTFYLQDLYVNQTDIYFCKIEVLYPPPYIDNEKSNGTIIHVKGRGPPESTTSPTCQHGTLQPTVPDTDAYPDASRLAPLHLLNTIALDRKGLPRLQPATLASC
ncbi:hypothetical protein J1605_013107 [Eschrichtius robustus]|uniref:T-cell-specific surface glycoprotein CD28 n=1 Tax=Eschrichtius robustus TaxID=9764 RepID=A0AB34GHV3_ESCRO|nr:hypothetical protein J1605_013107 [Eschrichtius robustus]